MDYNGIKEIRKRIDADLSNYKSIYGCYVNTAGDIVADFEIPVLDMTMEEKEMYSKLLKKVLSGKPDINLLDVELTDSQNQPDLLALSKSKLENPSLRSALYQQIIDSLETDKNYCILMASDTYDTGEETSHTYFLCGICPIKETKAELRYAPKKEEFRSNSTGSILSAPALGFIYPAFTDRATDIYGAVYYYNKQVHEELAEGVFSVRPSKTAAEQKEDFHNALEESLDDDYTIETTSLIQSKLTELEELETEFSAADIKEALLSTVDEDKLDDMAESMTDIYSIEAIREKKFTIETDTATITTKDPVGIKVKEIDGRQYILVPAILVKVNGREVRQ